MNKKNICPKCRGSKFKGIEEKKINNSSDSNLELKFCPECEGTGKIIVKPNDSSYDSSGSIIN